MRVKHKYMPVIAFLLLAGEILAQSGVDKILFIDFVLVKGQPFLTEMTIVDGKLKRIKQSPKRSNDIEFSVLSSEGKTLYQNSVENPAECVYEYPAGEGKIGRTTIKKDSTGFSIRIPYSFAINNLLLNVPGQTSSLNKSSNEPEKNMYDFIINHNKIKSRK